MSVLSPLASAAIADVLDHEKGYAEIPGDPGGPTNFGITLAAAREAGLDLDGDGDVDRFDVQKITEPIAREYYCRWWWERFGFGKLERAGVDERVIRKIFDLAVNVGPRAAGKFMQRALRACGISIADDGAIGDKSVAAACRVNPDALLVGIRCEAAGYYRLKCAVDHRENVIAGWLNRAYDCNTSE